MRRIPIQFDEEIYRTLKRRAFEEQRSIASIVRESVERFVSRRKPLTIADFTFVGAGRNPSDRKDRTSENHDEALAEAIVYRKKKR